MLLGSGNGTFSGPQFFRVGDAPQSVTLGDLDGDGILDIVTANALSNDVTVLIGNGDGTFQAEQTYAAGAIARSVDVGDVNGDGILDIVTANFGGGGSATVLLGISQDGLAPILDFSLGTQSDAIQALAPLKRKRESLSLHAGVLGAFQSRLQSAFKVSSRMEEGYTAAESRIRDADIALEVARFTQLSVLRDAGMAVLAQANLQPALVMQLLGETQ